MVKTSSSLASLHIGRLYDRQNCLLQSLQVAFLAVLSPGKSVNGMIVLLLKHVHLQKEVAAREGSVSMRFAFEKSVTHKHIMLELSRPATRRGIVIVAS